MPDVLKDYSLRQVHCSVGTSSLRVAGMEIATLRSGRSCNIPMPLRKCVRYSPSGRSSWRRLPPLRLIWWLGQPRAVCSLRMRSVDSLACAASLQKRSLVTRAQCDESFVEDFRSHRVRES